MTPAFASFLNWLDEDPRRYLNFITVKTKQTKPMSKDKYKHAREIIDAIEAGKPIQVWVEGSGGYWVDESEADQWCLESLNDPCRVRLKREPRRVWVNYSEGEPSNVKANKSDAICSAHPSWCSESAVEFVEVIR